MKFRITIIFLMCLSSLLFLSSCKNSTTETNQKSAHMTYVGKYDTPGYSEGIYVKKVNSVTYGFIADGTNGLQIISFTVPSSPLFVSHFQTSGSALNVKVASVNNSTFSCVSCGNQGLNIINVTNPLSPSLDTIVTYSNDLVLSSYVDTITKRLYVGTHNGYMYIYSLSNFPSSINLLGTYQTITDIMSIQVTSNGLAYLAVGSLRMEIVNVTNPATPSILNDFLASNLFFYDVKVSGSYAYIAGGNRMVTLNVSDPFNLVFSSAYSTGNSNFYALSLTTGQVFTAEGTAGVETIGVGTPQTPVQAGFYDTDDYANDIFYLDGYVYVADGADGVVVLKYSN